MAIFTIRPSLILTSASSVVFVAFFMACGEVADPGGSGPASSSFALRQDVACDFSGTWALKVTIPVKWAANAGIKAGEGMMIRWLRAQRQHTDAAFFVDSMVPCGSTGPITQSLKRWGGEFYGTAFDDRLFDSGMFPATSVMTRLSSSRPGATFTGDMYALELGLSLGQTDRAAWPANLAAMAPYLVDHDGDGHQGVSLHALEGHGMRHPPVGLSRQRRAQTFYVATRDLLAPHGEVETCDRLVGTATIPDAGGKPELQARTLGCLLEDGSTCSRSEIGLANMFAPPYQLAGSAMAVWVRVADNSSCRDIRDMF